MIKEASWNDFLSLRETIPVVDVRSPLEFAEGHIPAAVNIPLLNDKERIEVGTDYKQKGRQEAIRTGFRLVGPRLHEIIDKAEEIAITKELLVHCWRGGMRSSNFSQFVGMAGIHAHTLKGGYKTYRQYAQKSFEEDLQVVLISGCTGSGKSEVLRSLKETGEQVIDLEGLANHKGSAFGALMMPPQPTTEQFQNYLFEEIQKLDLTKPVWVEDESIAVGKIFLPNEFWKTMRKSPVVLLNVEKEVRIQRLVEEYGAADRKEFLEAMTRITKKLGGQHFKAAKEKMEEDDMHTVMDILLTYYDKAYTGSLQKRNPKKLGEVQWNGKNPVQAANQLIQVLKNSSVSI